MLMRKQNLHHAWSRPSPIKVTSDAQHTVQCEGDCGGREFYLSQVSTKTSTVLGPTGCSGLVVLYAPKSRLRWASSQGLGGRLPGTRMQRFLGGLCSTLSAPGQGLPSWPRCRTLSLVPERLFSLPLAFASYRPLRPSFSANLLRSTVGSASGNKTQKVLEVTSPFCPAHRPP